MKPSILYGFLFFLAGSVFSQTKMDISGSIEWGQMEMNAAVIVNLAAAGIKLPTGRIHAEEIITDEYPHLVKPHLLSLPVDSATTLGDMLDRGEISLQAIDPINLSVKKIPPSLSLDLSVMSSRYTLNLHKLSASLIRHSRPREAIRVLIPMPVASYTGIIIIAHEALPIHGRNSSTRAIPCIFPKIWDTNMNLIYERNMVDPELVHTIVRYVSPESIFLPTPSGIDEDIAKLVGSNPLRIIARGVFGIRPTDPIIDAEDALRIISSEDNRRLLREGRVVIVVHKDVLSKSF